MVRVSGPGQVTLTGLSVCFLRYSNSSTMPTPAGTVSFSAARYRGGVSYP